MANITLPNLIKKSINVTDPIIEGFNRSKVLYKDVKFDLNNSANTGIYNDEAINSRVSSYDIEAIVNEEAVVNSVRNWFHSCKYCRLLDPEVGLNLIDYLFMPVDEHTAYFIGLMITTRLPFYEPRINLEHCDITVDSAYDRFIIELKMTIPSLNNKIVNLKEVLESTGYSLF